MKLEKEDAKDGVLKVKYIFSLKEYQTAEDKVLKKMASKSNASGFRKGKVPVSLIKAQADPAQLSIDIMLDLVDQALGSDESKEIDYISRPEVLDFKTNDSKDSWYVEIQFIMKPEVSLPDYKKMSKDKKWAINKDDDDNVMSEKISSFFDQINQDSKIDIPQKIIDDTIKQHKGHDHSQEPEKIKEQIHRDLVFASLAEELEVKVDDNQLRALFATYQPANKKSKEIDRHMYENFRSTIVWQMFSSKLRDLLLVSKS